VALLALVLGICRGGRRLFFETADWESVASGFGSQDVEILRLERPLVDSSNINVQSRGVDQPGRKHAVYQREA